MEAPQQIHADNELCAQCEWTGMAQTVQIDIVLLRDGRHRRTFQRCSPFSAVEENICESGKSTVWHRNTSDKVVRHQQRNNVNGIFISMIRSKAKFYSDKLQLDCLEFLASLSWENERKSEQTSPGTLSVPSAFIDTKYVRRTIFAIGTHSAPMRTTISSSSQMLRKSSNIDLEHFSLRIGPTNPLLHSTLSK